MPFLKGFYKGKGHILMLHRIVPASNQKRVHNTVNEITPEKLSEIIAFYKHNNVDIISLDQVKGYLDGSQKGRFVCFTFDDGFKDNYHEALPVFEKYNAPFNIYITTGFPDHTIIIWWYLLEKVLLENDRIEFKWGEKTYRFETENHEMKETVFNEIRRIIIDTPFKDQRNFLKTAFSRYTADPYELTKELALTWSDIKKMAESSWVTIGAHTINHPALNQLSGEEILNEVTGSRERLELMTGKKIVHFSYPFGSAGEVGNREFEIIGETGFATATTTRTGNVFTEHLNHLMSLPRIGISPETSIAYLSDVLSGKAMFLRNPRQRIITE